VQFVAGALPLDLPSLEVDLLRVEAALRAAVESTDPFVTEVASHLISAGGKRLRPVLALAAAYTGDGAAVDDVVQGAVAVELVHIGSLYHDDVMDEATIRRGVESANSRFGNLVAILAGDFLLAKASEIAASLGVEVAGLLGRTIGRLCEGQVLELQTVYNPDRPIDSYLSSIGGKTASLFSTAARIGGITAGLPRPQVDSLTAYGEHVGMVFQICDDILDVIATDEQLGKPAGNDLVEGTYTLPVLFALDDPTVGAELRASLGGPIERGDVERVRKLVRASNGIERAIGHARSIADAAADAARASGNRSEREPMARLGHDLIDRLPR
jgi:heptaprenyl diphosphate synthase